MSFGILPLFTLESCFRRSLKKEFIPIDSIQISKKFIEELILIDVPVNQKLNDQYLSANAIQTFYMMKRPITISEFTLFATSTNYISCADSMRGSYVVNKDNTYSLKNGVNWKCDENGVIRKTGLDSFPVVHISWEDANNYCKWLSSITHKKIRLPSKKEWEFAAQEGNLYSNYKYSGSDTIDEVAWYLGNSASKIHKVCLKKPNRLGLYDMSGNVWEWCSDWCTNKNSSSLNNNDLFQEKVCKGGCFISKYNGESENECFVRYSGSEIPNVCAFDFSFRPIMEQ
jgi:formylglycine-generating enzyme required for sulfatase activity